MTKLAEIRQVAGAIEASEGVAETLDAGDVDLLAENPEVEIAPDTEESNPARDSFDSLPLLIGKIPGSLALNFGCYGSGSVATQPKFGKYFRACGAGESVLSSLTIGAITGGPFQHGETVTGGTSNATGRVIKKTTTGTTILYAVVLSGTFQSGEVLTGGTSGATATTSSVATAAGFVYEPIVDSVPSMSLSANNHEHLKKLRGARGKWKLTFPTGRRVMAALEFSGVFDGVADQALFTTGTGLSVPTYPKLMNSPVYVDSFTPKFSTIEINAEATLKDVDDPGSARGIKSFQITNRKVTGTMDPLLVAVSEHDFYTKLEDMTQMELRIPWGTVAGNKFEFYAPKMQYTNIKPGSRDGLAIVQADFQLNGSLTTKNDSWALLCL